jgi:tetratricopeptide (TPR) repeat protein/TolB-like protein
MKILKAIVFTVLLWSTNVFAQFDVGIVLPFENNSREPQLDWLGESFVETLSSDMASARLLMLDRRQRQAAFDSLGVPNTSILTDATVYKLAQTLDVNKLVRGRYEYVNGALRISARVLDMDGPTLSNEFVETGPLTSLIELQTGLAWQILHYITPTLSDSKSDFLDDHPPTRLDAFESYLRGVTAANRADQIRYMRDAARLDPQFTKPAFELGMIYFRNKDYRTSLLWFSKVRRGEPDYLEANYFLGLAYLYLEQYDRSETAFRVVAQQLPLNEVYNNLGIALARQNKPGGIGYFEKAIQSDPADADYQFNFGYALWKRDNCAQALPHLRRAMQGNGRPASWRSIYYECLDKSGQKEEAARQERLLQQQAPEWIKPKDTVRFENLEHPKDKYDGASFRQLRMLIQVQTELKHSKLPLKEHVALHYEQAQDLLRDGFDREAAEQLQQAIDYDPEFVLGYLSLGRIYAKSGRFQEATRTLNNSLQHQKTPDAYLILAKIYLEQGKLEDAQSQIDHVLALEPSSAEAAMLMQELNSKNALRQ